MAAPASPDKAHEKVVHRLNSFLTRLDEWCPEAEWRQHTTDWNWTTLSTRGTMRNVWQRLHSVIVSLDWDPTRRANLLLLLSQARTGSCGLLWRAGTSKHVALWSRQRQTPITVLTVSTAWCPLGSRIWATGRRCVAWIVCQKTKAVCKNKRTDTTRYASVY